MSEPNTTPRKFVTAAEVLEKSKQAEKTMREYFVEREMQRMIRRELSECYNRERVNHLKKCSVIAQEYLRRVLKKDNIRQPASKPSQN
jgi:predicted component of type VI protein secretion system